MYLLAGWLRDNEESGQGCHGVSAGHEACRVEGGRVGDIFGDSPEIACPIESQTI